MFKICAVCKKEFDPKKVDRVRVEIRKHGSIKVVWFCSVECMKQILCKS